MRDLSVNGVQAGIIRQLFYRERLRFAQLNVDRVPSDQFSYHLRQLVKWGVVEKGADNQYSLTINGKDRALMLSPKHNSFIVQGFVAVRVVLSKIENGTEYFLLQKRTMVPYKGTYGTPGDKIMFGEDVVEAAVRAMRQQTGLACDMELRGIRHIKDRFENKLRQDKYFFVFSATNPRGKLHPVSAAGNGKNVWLSLAELEASGRSIQGGVDILQTAKNTTLTFQEVTYDVDSY
ncbi:MAG TPA: NUDIX domain-containing protein [Candidatus Saccharimonadales bacterium]|nr:NUDIX domain-containing protein [Candidatus Saccharimonadales bacterium]